MSGHLSRVAVSLGAQCSNRCFFCAQGDTTANPVRARALVHADLEQAATENRGVTFVGGEPMTHDDLADLTRAAKRMGVAEVGLQTNGAGFAPQAANLAKAGVDDVHITVLGPTAASHDYHTDTAGSFAQIEAAVAAARTVSIPFVATTVVTRSNFRDLAAVAIWLEARGAAAWMIAWPHTAGRAQANFDRAIPRIGMAAPYALHAARRAQGSGLATAIEGLPLCAFGPHGDLATFASPLREPHRREFAGACGECAHRPACGGVDRAYLDRFGDEEIRASLEPAAAPGWGNIEARWRSLFAGPGPLLQTEMTPALAPAAARRRLPVLGRPRPAAAEVRKRSDAKQATEAKGLFPALYASDGSRDDGGESDDR